MAEEETGTDPTALLNLIDFCNKNLGTNINPQHDEVEVGSSKFSNIHLFT